MLYDARSGSNLFHSLATTAIPWISSLLPPSLVNERNCIGDGGGISLIYIGYVWVAYVVFVTLSTLQFS